jgi:hypothetical protein
MNAHLSRRFREQTEATLNYALAEDIDPRQEYLRIVAGQYPDGDDGSTQVAIPHDPNSPLPLLDSVPLDTIALAPV